MKKNILWIASLALSSCGNSNENYGAVPPLNVIGSQAICDNLENTVPEYLYKIISPEEWQKSQLQHYVVNSAIDTGFIHLATEEQVRHVAQKFWNNKNYVILKLASHQLTGHLIKETNPGGSTPYYHLYEGNIPLSAVVDVQFVKAAPL